MSHAVSSSVRDPKCCTNQNDLFFIAISPSLDWPGCLLVFSFVCRHFIYSFFSRAVNQLFLNQINYIIHQLIHPLSKFAEKASVAMTQLLKQYKLGPNIHLHLQYKIR